MMGHRKIVIVSVVLVLLAVLGIWCHARAIFVRQDRLNAAHQELRQSEATIQRLRDEVELFRQTSASVELKPSIDAVDMIKALNGDLTDLGAIRRSLTTGSRTDQHGVCRTPVSVSFNSSFLRVFELLKRIDRYRGLLQVQRLVIARDPTSPTRDLNVFIRMEAIVPNTPEPMP